MYMYWELWCFVAKSNLGKVNLELMLPAVFPLFAHDLWGHLFGVRRGKPHTALLSSNRCDQYFYEGIFADS